ncbi:MAG: hypothetical protein KDE09_05310 [Anaerolineales bacterium]|nr:hypothetical protein [Anaerolineales bacterium]MCB8962795.1 hypothetical protein [Ardenticatenales bacterium]MCB0005785.1 hypothetical protein [Anaerolineales bacterium]MCB0011303.1 hypothetical protein [Anaerolineales bacterium]MCB0017188.1 hypothetical protein [Anaerolineales bacterium]
MGNEETVAATLYGPTGRKLARVLLEDLRFRPAPVGGNQIERNFKFIGNVPPQNWRDQAEVFVRSMTGWQAIARVTAWPSAETAHGVMEFV